MPLAAQPLAGVEEGRKEMGLDEKEEKTEGWGEEEESLGAAAAARGARE